jgi:hypothetical protein
MKKIILLWTMLLLVFTACTKDSINDENSDLFGLKRANVPIPIKADFCMTPDLSAGFILIQGLDPADPNSYLPKKAWISGHASHHGELITNQSYNIFLSAMITPYGIYATSEGKITADNGDSYFFTSTTYTNPFDRTYTGNVHMFGGNGKFENATGDVVMTGQGQCWTAEGTMTYTK